MRELLSLDETRRSALLKGPYVSLSRPFREGATVAALVACTPTSGSAFRRASPPSAATRNKPSALIAAGQTTLVSTGTGSGKSVALRRPSGNPGFGKARLSSDDTGPGAVAQAAREAVGLAREATHALLRPGGRLAFVVPSGL